MLHVQLNQSHQTDRSDADTLLDLHELWHELTVSSDSIHCIILTGYNKQFYATADEQIKTHPDLLEKTLLAMTNCPIPIITAMEGTVSCGGLDLALASDFSIATRNTNFIQTQALIPITQQQLINSIGLRRGKQLIFTGESFDAKQALAWGIINQIVTIKDLLSTAMQLGKQIINHWPIRSKQIKLALLNDSNQELG
jgi:enoyl-CoA hydratase/carnithine racemase